jgi:hypothetical protein
MMAEITAEANAKVYTQLGHLNIVHETRKEAFSLL